VPGTPGPDRQATTEGILRAIRDIYGPAAGTSEIAEKVDVSRQAADKRLRELAEEGLVNTRKIGQVRVWWLSDEGERLISDTD